MKKLSKIQAEKLISLTEKSDNQILNSKEEKELQKLISLQKQFEFENSKSENSKSAKQIALDKLNAKQISDKVSAEKKSIFKKEFQTKQYRSSCRDKFQNAINRYMLFLQKGNKDLAEKHLLECKEIAKKFYLAEDKFQSASDYYTSGMNAEKRENIDLFIELVK